MHQRPHFSIVIPTKDRVNLAKEVIFHNLKQSYSNFEIVVVDNGATSELYDWACSLENPQIKPFRTGGLNMPDNWQFAFDHASGEIILMSEDKIFLHSDCLMIAKQIFDTHTTKLITWCIGVGKDSVPSEPTGFTPDFSVQTSKAIVELALGSRLDSYQKVAPRAINMAFLRTYAEEIERKVGRLFRPITPDYSCGCFLLSGVESYLHTYGKMSYVPLQAPSNGTEVINNTEKGQKFFKEMGIDRTKFVACMPCKQALLGNLLLADMLGFWKITDLGDLQSKLDERAYWLMIISEVLLAKRLASGGQEIANAAIREIRSLPLLERLRLIGYATGRFIAGWPNRKLKMRDNAKGFFMALRLIAFGC